MRQINEIVKSEEKRDEYQIIDVRPANRFNSEVDEPRKGCRRGHIKGAVNLPFL